MFLSANGLLYQGTVDDPVFSAHYEIYSTNTFTFYSSDFCRYDSHLVEQILTERT